MKEYVKPEVTEIAIESNQAVASCAVIGGVTISPIGYRCQWDGASMANTAELSEHVKSAHGEVEVPDEVIPYCWYVQEIGGDGSLRWEDFNRNGVYDAGDNKQDVHWWSSAGNVLTS